MIAVLVLAMLLPMPRLQTPCLTVEQAQARIDAAPDGVATAADLKLKLRFGAGPFTIIDFSGECVDGPGALDVTGRQGLWFRSVMGPGVAWQVTGSEAVIFTNPQALSITIDGGSARVETYKTAGGSLAVANGLVYAGKVFVEDGSFHAVSGFVRGSDFAGVLSLSGEMTGFGVAGVSYGELVNTATGDFTFR